MSQLCIKMSRQGIDIFRDLAETVSVVIQVLQNKSTARAENSVVAKTSSQNWPSAAVKQMKGKV